MPIQKLCAEMKFNGVSQGYLINLQVRWISAQIQRRLQLENEGPEVKSPNSNSAWKWGRKNKIWGQPLIESVPDTVNSVSPPFTDD